MIYCPGGCPHIHNLNTHIQADANEQCLQRTVTNAQDDVLSYGEVSHFLATAPQVHTHHQITLSSIPSLQNSGCPMSLYGYGQATAAMHS